MTDGLESKNVAYHVPAGRVHISMMNRILKVILVFVICSHAADAFAWTKSGTTYTTNGSQSDVASAVTASVNGDTIILPAGTFSWFTGISTSKNITISGNGYAKTTIQNTGTAFSMSGNGSWRITGIHTVSSSATGHITASGTGGWRIDNNKFEDTSTASHMGVFVSFQSTAGQPVGLIDHNIFNNTRIYVQSALNTPFNTLMDNPKLLGTANSVYVENNIMDRTRYCAAGGTGNAIDLQYGGSVVFRFNTVVDADLQIHGAEGSYGSYANMSGRAGRYWELYNNTLSHPTASCWDRAMMIRGGTGVIFNNTITGAWNGGGLPRIDLDTHGRRDGGCNGTSPVDGNSAGRNGWPCRDQIGRATDAFLWTSGGAVPSQASEPAYFWNNTNFSPTTTYDSGDSAYIVQDRDYFEDDTSGMRRGVYASIPGTCTVGQGYWATDRGSWNQSGSGGQGILYKCTTTNTWTVYYTPYTYPHPLTNASFSPPPTGGKIPRFPPITPIK